MVYHKKVPEYAPSTVVIHEFPGTIGLKLFVALGVKTN